MAKDKKQTDTYGGSLCLGEVMLLEQREKK